VTEGGEGGGRRWGLGRGVGVLEEGAREREEEGKGGESMGGWTVGGEGGGGKRGKGGTGKGEGRRVAQRIGGGGREGGAGEVA